MKTIARLLMVSALLFVFVPSSNANDSIVFDNGHNVYPIKTDKVKMVSEKITIDMHDIGARLFNAKASVTCEFIFENLSDNEITTEVGFPTITTDTYMSNTRISLIDFRSFINGKEISVAKKEEVLQTWNPEDTDGERHYSYRYWYTWDVTFPPGEQIKIRNTYTTKLSYSSLNQRWFTYILVTGANWAGKIYESTIEVIYKNRETLYRRATNASPKGFKINDNKITWVLRDFIPSANIEIMEDWDNINEQWLSGYYLDAIRNLNTKTYEGDKRLYTAEDVNFNRSPASVIKHYSSLVKEHLGNIYTEESVLNDLKRMQARILRNEIFARHGRKFKSMDLSKVFSDVDWYKPNPNYSDNMLNDIEKKNIRFILDYEKKIGWR
jgi:hypothetical protein